MNPPELPPAARSPGRHLSVLLFELAHDSSRERISVADLLDALSDRALAAMMFIFAAINVLPLPPGASSVLGAPLVFLAPQLMLGLRPWLPARLARRSIARADFVTLVRRLVPWVMRAEKLLRPRLGVLVRPPFERLVGLLCLLLALLVVLPIPLGNALPSLAISFFALGILERDGYCILAGLFTSVVAAVVVSGVLFALTKAALFMLAQVLQ
ncbi:exopolysaccharide biosynthesis protein [Hydrogenophaga sp.]|uniref:exopolysaccharide biosynthesis protein n=1 Tax=Hydrogenophaga sp. TaxID=1904254 RepID=UPI001986F66D|nr:exopolysaccharide biosynthesis protein [Hydrogenophaga sp.]MBD3893518.1 exopolysaccharide biosynthesis protein [Hydrogenophaga sp.]